MRILSGMRPTGSLHVGHLKGVLEVWKKLTGEEKQNECFFLIADYHALTTDWADSKKIQKLTYDMVSDWIAAGLQSEKAIIFRQSDVKEHSELFLILSMIIPLGWLERNPTYKESKNEMGEERVGTLGFLGYPVLQAADILLYKADMVPVGKDQLPHLEITRDIAERFNHIFGSIFPLPKPVLSPTPKILGTDGRKMSKSYDNAIILSDDIKVNEEKIKTYMTDTARKTKKDPGDPKKCPLFTLHEAFTSQSERKYIDEMCKSA